MIDENQVRQIVQGMMTDTQYGVPPVPAHEHTGVDSSKIQFSNLSNAPRYFCAATTTNATTAVYVFGSTGATFNVTITGVFLISNDTTAGNITLMNNGTQATLIAKGTTAGAMVGATSLINTAYVKGTQLYVTSSTAGNATVFVTFTT